MKITKTAFIIIPIIVIVAITCHFIFRKKQINPVTGKAQAISLTPEQEVAVGIACAPQLAAEFGGLYPNRQWQKKIKAIGRKLVAPSPAAKSSYQFDFHLLADSQAVCTYALPGGQIFITLGMFKKLKTDDDLAAVLSHAIGHVIGRHASEKLFKTKLLQTSNDSINLHDSARQTSKYLSNFMAMTYDDEDEIEADALSIQYMAKAGYDPKVVVSVFEMLKENSDMSLKHPVTTDRIEKMKEAIQKFKN
ncbi:M48 family metallopeptidase [Dyadobacter sp. LHD-138]|uniref:M48 family metallopeptidase n=1 Tax=Dyadobacter sp. LHD-138 TaxID=3071413 RepID=UPI0027E107E4|nr:M48 family metallopeptidase [Dyadobacter sp. LHD-138]MDQ6477383.1 M48 family metallopeptidase [Dyadobacter sp. LHD-138]